ncbi:hypothetical protein MTsPCn3_30410 [Erythrobacter sp. MTPC3]
MPAKLGHLVGGRLPSAARHQAGRVFRTERQLRSLCCAKNTGLALALIAAISACDATEPDHMIDWRDHAINVRVGDAVFELAPGRAYSVGDLTDEEINSSIANGLGRRASPLSVRDIRVGMKNEDTGGLKYDVTVTKLQGHFYAGEATNLLHSISEISELSFALHAIDVLDEEIQNDVTVRFNDGTSQHVPVTCRAQHLPQARRVVICSDLRLAYRDNLLIVNPRSGTLTEALQNYSDALSLISNMQHNQ